MDRSYAATILSTVGQSRKDGDLGVDLLLQIRQAVFQAFFIVEIGSKQKYLPKKPADVSKEWEVLVGEPAVIHGAFLFVVKYPTHNQVEYDGLLNLPRSVLDHRSPSPGSKRIGNRCYQSDCGSRAPRKISAFQCFCGHEKAANKAA
jgi:hypothetical protein